MVSFITCIFLQIVLINMWLMVRWARHVALSVIGMNKVFWFEHLKERYR
jgi:hypothetical protein